MRPTDPSTAGACRRNLCGGTRLPPRGNLCASALSRPPGEVGLLCRRVGEARPKGVDSDAARLHVRCLDRRDDADGLPPEPTIRHVILELAVKRDVLLSQSAHDVITGNDSGTTCGSFIFMRSTEIDQMPTSRSKLSRWQSELGRAGGGQHGRCKTSRPVLCFSAMSSFINAGTSAYGMAERWLPACSGAAGRAWPTEAMSPRAPAFDVA